MSTTSKASSAQSSDPKSIGDHLGELRRRLTWVVLTLIVMSALAYSVHDALVSFVLSPIGDQKLVYLTPGGGFTFIFQIILYAGLLLTAPVLVYHLYRFVAPALPESMRHMGLRVVFLSSVLMLAGAAFGYFVAVPAALQFLMAFAGDFVQANLTADSYLNFLVAYVIGLGILFQLPLFLVAWNWLNPLPPGGLLSSQRFVIVGAFIAAALLTPTPDVLNQSLLAIPVIAVYQIGVVAVYITNKKKRRQPVQAQAPVVAAEPTVPAARHEQPVFDIQALLGSHIERRPTKPKPVQAVATKPVVIPKPVPQVRSTKSLDGFSGGGRASNLAVPGRRATNFRPALKRSGPVRQPTTRSQQSSRSIDGFSII